MYSSPLPDPSARPPVEWLRRRLRLRNRLAVNVLSELFACFLFMLIGNGLSVQFLLSGGRLNSYMQSNVRRRVINDKSSALDKKTDKSTHGGKEVTSKMCFAWGMMITLLVYGTFHTSGGHLNPAVSLAFVSLGQLPLGHFLLYALAQTIGMFFGTAVCYHVYTDVLNKFDGGIRAVGGANGTAMVFTSFPEPHITHYTAFISEIVGAALLVLFINVLIDPRNKVPKCLQPIGFGLDLFVVTSSFGMNVGSPMNPARDFGPRLFLFFAGYGWEVFSWHHYYFWIPMVAPFGGALLGTWFYQLCVGIHVPDREEIAHNHPPEAMDNSLNTVISIDLKKHSY